MTTELLERPVDAATRDLDPLPHTEASDGTLAKTKEMVLISWSGEYDKVMPTLILK